MATQQEHTDHTNSTYSFTNITDFYKASEIKVKHVADDGTTTDPVSTSNVDTTNKEVTLSSAVTDGTITVYRETDLTGEDIEFQAGSSIKSVDLNKAQEVLRRGIEETREQETYQTGAEIKTAYEAQSNTNAYTDDEKSKLSGIATGAQTGTVTSVTGSSPITVSNGTTTPAISIDLSSYSTTSHNHDSSYNNYSISSDLLDEDDMASNSNTKVPSQQSVKAYVDANAGSGGIALTDISVTSASAGTAALSYNNSSGVFSYTPPDLSGYSGTSHNHDSSYSASSHNHDSSYSASSHNHDSSYNNYAHPTTAGNIHIPSGGSTGQFLKYSGVSGTAVWDDINSGISDIVEDTTPQLGGILDCNNKAIQESIVGIGTGTSSGSISNNLGTIKTVLTSSGTPDTFTLDFDSNSFPNGTSALYLIKNAGDKTIVFSDVVWIGGYAPTISTTKYSAIEFVYVSGVNSTNAIGCYLGDVG
tara:strand:+ start:14024 stop:15445 length:1422 start_codon:yes stop_codon:yes gene_type:complete